MDSQKNNSFGTIKGVLIPNITMMFGVILFLRLGVITASAGLGPMLGAIALSTVIMVLTSLSVGSLVTNMKVEKGGVYYILSRTLGVEIGGAIGIIIYFAQLISITLTVSGFAISFCELFPEYSVSFVELCTLILLALLSASSASWALRLQGLILCLLGLGILSVLLGSAENLAAPATTKPFYSEGTLSFWQCFALFYPAMTGIEAGMAMSGELRDPGKSLFHGNLYSLIFVAIAYAALSVFAYFSIPQENLVVDPFALVEIARWPQLVWLGIWCATLSSALGSLLGAPRMLQAMAEDGVVSSVLARSYGRFQEPRVALGLTVLIAAVLILATTIDQVIPMLAMICLVSYGLLNFVTALSQLMNTPYWRPQLRVPWRLSLLAVMLIVIAMFMIAPGWTFITLLVLVAAYVGLRARDINSGFQDLRESFIFFLSRLALYRLGTPTSHALTWHPQLLVLLSAPNQALSLVHLSHSLTRRSGILTFATVVLEESQTHGTLQSTRDMISRYFERLNIACLSEVYPASSLMDGYVQLVKAYGIGPIQPNTVAVKIQDGTDLDTLVDFIGTCQLMKKNLLLLKDSDHVSLGFFTSRRTIRKKAIDLWWNPEEGASFDLTLSLVTTLTDGQALQGARVSIKTVVSSENAREAVADYLKEYVARNRLDVKVQVFLEGELQPPAAPLSFFCLTCLKAEADDEERGVYKQYLSEVIQGLRSQTVAVLVSSYDNVEHCLLYASDAHSSLTK